MRRRHIAFLFTVLSPLASGLGCSVSTSTSGGVGGSTSSSNGSGAASASTAVATGATGTGTTNAATTTATGTGTTTSGTATTTAATGTTTSATTGTTSVTTTATTGTAGSCTMASDCPGQDTGCSKRTCTLGVCGVSNAAVGSPVTMQTAGDCKKNQCNGQGSVESVIDDTDVPPSTACASGSCNQGVVVITNQPINTACGAGNALKCDGAGNCVTCNDASQCPPAANQCAIATCNAHMCGTANKADGVACDDGNACTLNDTCTAGTCGGTAVTCSALDQCHIAGTCNPATGACNNPPAPDGTSCNDNNPCTTGDQCTGGACGGVGCSITSCNTALNAFNGMFSLNWTFNGTAIWDNTAQTVKLVDDSEFGEAGSVVFNNPILLNAFDTADVTFDFRVTVGPGGRADGLAFFLETNGATALGGTGGGFGAVGLAGYAAEFDVYNNGACTDVNGNHAGVDSLAACAANNALPTALATSPDLFDNTQPGGGIGDIGDGQWRTVVVHFASDATTGNMSVTINGTLVPNLQGVPLTGFMNGTAYYFGFSAGTGALAAKHEIRNVQMNFSSPHCL